MECPACHSPNIDDARFCAKCGALLPAASKEADPLIGKNVGGRYRITGILGEGGMGRVYTGEQQMGTSLRKVAVKTLLSQYAKDPQVLARFMRECGTVSELEHQNTIKVYDFGQTDTGELYIAMELLSGTSLETALEKGALAPSRVDRILGQICGSLQEAHEKGIVHRDLKPANIYLTVRAGEEDYVKVLDFGIAKRDDKHSKDEQKLTKQGTVLGTPPYMSPEQFKGQELDARSDIYSLGVVAYEMLTGRLPFDANTPWEWATQHMTAQPLAFEASPHGSQVPAKMKTAVLRALAKDKAQRQQTVLEFYDEVTLGAPQPAMLGRSRSIHSDGGASVGGASVLQAGQSAGGHTQVGEPLFAPPPQPAGRTVVDPYPSGPSAIAAQQQAPTGGGQVFAPPPSSSVKKGGPGLMIAAAAVALVVVLVVAVVALKRKGPDATDAVIPLPSASAPSTVASEGPDAGELTVTIDAGAHVPAHVGTGTVPVTPHPPVDRTAEAACQGALNLAHGTNVAMAAGTFRGCAGPTKESTLRAIDDASRRAAAQGCSALKDVTAAAQVGAGSGLSILKAKGCH